MKLDVGKYAFVHGTSAAVRKYSMSLQTVLSESTVRGFRREIKKMMLDKGELTSDQLYQPVDAASLPPPPKKGRQHSWEIRRRV